MALEQMIRHYICVTDIERRRMTALEPDTSGKQHSSQTDPDVNTFASQRGYQLHPGSGIHHSDPDVAALALQPITAFQPITSGGSIA